MCLTFKGVSYIYGTRTSSTDFPATHLYLAPLYICVTQVKVSRTYMYLTFKGISYIYVSHISSTYFPAKYSCLSPPCITCTCVPMHLVHLLHIYSICCAPLLTQHSSANILHRFFVYMCVSYLKVSHIYTYLYMYVSPPPLLSSRNTAARIFSTDFSYICVFHI